MSDGLHGVSLEDLLRELDLGTEARAGYRTRAEWQEHLGVSARRMGRIMRRAKVEGKLAVRREHREALDGTLRWVPVYRFVLGRE